MEIIIAGLVCLTVFLCIDRLTSKGLHFTITHETKTDMVELPQDSDTESEKALDGVLAELYDAFDINVGSKEDTE